MLIQRSPLLLHYIIININLFTCTWDTIKLLIASLIIQSLFLHSTPLYIWFFSISVKGTILRHTCYEIGVRLFTPFFLKQNVLHVFTVSSQLKMRSMSYMCNRIKHVAMLTGGIKKVPVTLHCIKDILKTDFEVLKL